MRSLAGILGLILFLTGAALAFKHVQAVGKVGAPINIINRFAALPK